MNKMSIRKDDLVVVLSGKDKGKQGEQGGVLKKEAPIYACKVQLMCPHCNKPRRFRTKVLADGTKERVCVKCGNSL